jgi:thiol:disulfide interchange protein DsbA
MWLYFLGEVDFPMFRINKLPLLLFSLLGYLTILFTFSGSVTPTYGQETSRSVLALGKGPYEIIIFTDYFCPPCKSIDTITEPLLKELLATNKVKITFVDVPFHKATPLYAKYYLYATKVDSNQKSVFYIRKTLFNAAQVNRIEKEDALVAYLKKHKVLWKAMDERSIYPILTALTNENTVKDTPTFVIKYSAKDVKKFVGGDNIWNGLTALKTHISSEKK